MQGQLPIGRPRIEPGAKPDEPIVARNDVVILVSEENQDASDGASDDRTHGTVTACRDGGAHVHACRAVVRVRASLIAS